MRMHSTCFPIKIQCYLGHSLSPKHFSFVCLYLYPKRQRWRQLTFLLSESIVMVPHMILHLFPSYIYFRSIMEVIPRPFTYTLGSMHAYVLVSAQYVDPVTASLPPSLSSTSPLQKLPARLARYNTVPPISSSPPNLRAGINLISSTVSVLGSLPAIITSAISDGKSNTI